MENILGVGSITIADLNDALISGDAPRNPDEGALWIDSSANTPVLKVYKNGSWQPQEIDVNNLDPELSETVTTIVNTLGTLANDGLLTYTDRLQLSVEIASIIGQIPSKQNGNVYPNTLPAYNIIDSLGVGSFSNLRQTARDATVPTDNTYYITLERAYTALNTYLSSLTPRPWDVTLANKDKNTEVANPDTYREALLNYYLAEMNLATYTEKRATEAANEYTDESVHDVITSVDVEYATSTESNTVPDDDEWDTLAPTWSNGIFIWSRTVTTYKNGTTFISEPANITGAKIEIGGRNLLRDSGAEVSNGDYNIARYDFTDEIKENEEVTLTIWGELASTKSNFGAYNSAGTVSVTTLTDNGDGTYSSTFKWPIGSSDNHYLNVYAFTNTQTGTSTINKIKLERGNIATDWTEAPEDTQAKIDEKAGSEYVSTTLKYYNVGIIEEIDKIVGTVQEDTVTKTEFGTYQQSLETKFTQDAKSFQMDFDTVTSSVQTLEGAVQEEFDEVKKYIRFIDGKIILGEVGNQITLEISKEKISFLQGEDEVAKLTNNELEITDARIKHELRIGDYAFKPRANGSVDFG